MKILHIITTIDRGGAEKQLLILIREQIKLHDVTVIPLKGALELSDEIKRLGAKVISKYTNLSFARQLIGIKRHLIEQGYDLVHAHLPRSEVLAFSLVSGEALILTRHNAEHFWPKYPGRLSQVLAKLVTRRANTVICISQAVANFVVDSGEVSSRCRLEVVHYGYSLEPISVNNNQVSVQSLKIVNVARHVPQKDILTLLEGFATFLSHSPQSTLTLVGQGADSIQIKQEILLRGIERSVKMIDRAEDIEELLETFELFVLTSLYEGFGMVYFEATSAGLPVLTSRHETSVELFGPKYEGLFDVGASTHLAKLLLECLNTEFRISLLRHARARLQQYSVHKMSSRIEHIYSKAVKK